MKALLWLSLPGLVGCATLGIGQPPPFDEKQEQIVIEGLCQWIGAVPLPGAAQLIKEFRP